MSHVDRLIGASLPATDLLLRDVHVLDPRAALDGRLDVLVADGRIAELAEAGTIERSDVEIV